MVAGWSLAKEPTWSLFLTKFRVPYLSSEKSDPFLKQRAFSNKVFSDSWGHRLPWDFSKKCRVGTEMSSRCTMSGTPSILEPTYKPAPSLSCPALASCCRRIRVIGYGSLRPLTVDQSKAFAPSSTSQVQGRWTSTSSVHEKTPAAFIFEKFVIQRGTKPYQWEETVVLLGTRRLTGKVLTAKESILYWTITAFLPLFALD